MPDNNYQAEITKLEALHSFVIKSEDDRNFFSHLYRYLEYICDNGTLEANAWRLFSETYLQDHGADENSSDLRAGTFEKQFTKVLNDYRGDSRFYNSWLYLCIFYYVNTVSPNNIAKIGANEQQLESPQSQLATAILQHELRSAKFHLDNSGNTELKRSDFSLYLEVFHSDYISWLSDNPSIFTETNTSLPISSELSEASADVIGNAHLRLDGRVLYVDLPNEPSVIFCTYREGLVPLSLMEYIDMTYKAKADTEFSRTDFAEKVDNFMYDTTANALRACGFDKHVKPMFFVRAPKGKIKFNPTKQITGLELQYILNCAKKNEEKRKSTGSQK